MKTLLCLAALVIAAACATPALAVQTVRHPVKVTTCNPSRNVMYTGGGWTPGYYPANPFYFPTVYGYTYYQPPVRTQNPTLAIDYTNATQHTMKQIEFGLVANGNLVAEVKDVGTFSPGVEIKHEFGLSSNVFPLQTSMVRCMPLKITFADGSKWRSSHLPRLLHRLRE
jgi:hypothetical protein